ncbi:hypothetical protein B5M09_008778 [Aphanomyces astaci]|uniref:Peptidase M20 dimerisation domain-containing protein n=1 Tax=Aphanomyces astaci TaxID=112090 RepID=A0A425CNE0_APHAT|nr:hypothetical protein B5M09_008778 [Aphanomyces astaci]
MQELGFLEDIHEFSPVEGKPIVVATWKGKDASLPSILLNSHYDVVPVMEQFWNYEPFGVRRSRPSASGELLENGMIVGRGTQDMKCVCVQYLEALRLLHSTGFVPARNIHLSYVPDEEIGGSDGMGKFLKSNQYQAMLPIALALDEGLANPTNKFTGTHHTHSSSPAMLDEWCCAEGVSWEFVSKNPLHQHHVTSVEDETNPLCAKFLDVAAKLGMDVELDVFPAATDSRFLRQLGVPALGFSPMNNTEVLLHEHNEMLHKDTFVRGIHLFKGIFEQLFDN